jgi:hypothetical protein
MLDTIKNILSVVKSLMGLSGKLKAGEDQRRKRMSALFVKISDCLAAVSAEIRAGGVPHGKCAEMQTYGDELPKVIAKEVGETKAAELGKLLHSAYAVEQLAIDLKKSAKREPHLRQIEEASGKFRALATMMRV